MIGNEEFMYTKFNNVQGFELFFYEMVAIRLAEVLILNLSAT